MINSLKIRLLATLHHVREEMAEKQFSLSLISAALVVILGSFSFFERLESITYRLTSSMQVPFVSNTAALAEDPANIPRVLLISSDMYEKVFQQVSPLNRGRLEEVFSSILGAGPAALAVDLDISPTLASGPEQDRLDQALLGAARRTHIVLATPFPVENAALRLEKFHWMQKLCNGGVHFGVPTLHAADGMVLRYNPEVPTFPQVAAGLAGGTRESDHESSHEHAKGPPAANACQKLADGHIERADFLDPGFFVNTDGQGPGLKNMKLINANYFDPAMEAQISAFSSVAEIPGAKELGGRVVFLGGQYGIDDRFETLNGERYGAVIHAAIFYSLTHPLKEVPEWICRLVDVLLGTVLAAVFQALWGAYYRNLNLYKGLRAAETFEDRILRAHAFGQSVLTLLGVLGVSAVIMWALLLVSTIALKHGSQFSIAFMAFAMLAYCMEWNRKGSAAEEVRQGLSRLRARLEDPAHAGLSPVEIVDQFLMHRHQGAHHAHVRGFLAETASHVAAFLARRWHDIRFIWSALPATPLASFWALAEMMTSLVPIAAVAWAITEAVLA